MTPILLGYIFDSAYEGNINLKDVIIADGIIYIGDKVFRNCTGLTSIIIPDSVTIIGSGAFGGCIGLTSITIPSSVISIHECVFENCISLVSIIILAKVISIDSDAFDGCTNLTTICANSINLDILDGIPSLKVLIMPLDQYIIAKNKYGSIDFPIYYNWQNLQYSNDTIRTWVQKFHEFNVYPTELIDIILEYLTWHSMNKLYR